MAQTRIEAGVTAGGWSQPHFKSAVGFTAGIFQDMEIASNDKAVQYASFGLQFFDARSTFAETGAASGATWLKVPVTTIAEIEFSGVALLAQIGAFAGYAVKSGMDIRRFNFGVTANAGVRFSRFMVKAGVDDGFLNLSRGDGARNTTRDWTVTLGYRF